MMKFSTSKLFGLSLVCGLLMVGCNKQETPAQKKDEPKAETTQTQPQTNAPVCDDIGAKNSLVRALSVAVNDEVTGLMSSYKNAEQLDLARRTQQQLGQINLDLQNIRADGDTCLADVVAVVPASDLTYAERYYQANGKPTLAELGQTHSVQMSDGRIVTPVRYTIQDGKASLTETPSALGFIANVVSASAYLTAQGAGRVNTNARPAVSVQPPPRLETPRPRPVQREPEVATPAPSETNNASENTNSEPQTPPTAKPVAPKPETPAADTAKPEPKPAPVEGDGEIAIVETDETY